MMFCVLRIIFSSAPIEESNEEKPGIILDFDKVGNVVAMGIRGAAKRVENPGAGEFTITGQESCRKSLWCGRKFKLKSEYPGSNFSMTEAAQGFGRPV